MYDAWVRSGYYMYARSAHLLTDFGGQDVSLTDYRFAVRPALLDCNKLKKPRISRAFGVIARV